MNLSRREPLSADVLEATEEGLDLTEGGVKVKAQKIIRQAMQDKKIRHASSWNKNAVLCSSRNVSDVSYPVTVEDERIDKAEKECEGGTPGRNKAIHSSEMLFEI